MRNFFRYAVAFVAVLCLLTELTACQSVRKPCVSGWVRPAPQYFDREAFCSLQQQVDCLIHQFQAYEIAMDRCHFPRRVCKRLIKIDNDLQHANAVMLSHEVAPKKIQRQLDRISRDLAWVAERSCVPPLPECCCHVPAPIGRLQEPSESWLRHLSETILNRYAKPKSKARQESQNPEPTADQNGPECLNIRSIHSLYSNPEPTR